MKVKRREPLLRPYEATPGVQKDESEAQKPLLRPYEATPGVQKDESEAQRTPFASL